MLKRRYENWFWVQDRTKDTLDMEVCQECKDNQSNYSTVCLLLNTWHRTDHCITVIGKWIFDSNLKVALPITQDYLNYICRGNNTDENKFIGVLHAIRSVPPEVVQRILNMK